MYYRSIETIKEDLQGLINGEFSEETLNDLKEITEQLEYTLKIQKEIDNHEVHPQVIELLKVPMYPQKSEMWFQQRSMKLTSSDLDTVLGNNKYAKPEEVLFKKNGLRKPFFGNEATRHGEKYEDEAIRLYCERHNKKTFAFGLLPHPTIEYLAGSPDDITYDGIVVEVKCPLRRKIIPGEIPIHYQSQLQMNMEIAKLDKGVFIEYQPQEVFGEEVLNVVHIERDITWFDTIFPKLESFWNLVLQYQGCIETHPLYDKYYTMYNKPKIVDKNIVCLCDTRSFEEKINIEEE
jgi:putative phage-type endonuclease